jgi:hypothetical protein
MGGAIPPGLRLRPAPRVAAYLLENTDIADVIFFEHYVVKPVFELALFPLVDVNSPHSRHFLVRVSRPKP